jgi:hypothetical protein
LERGKIGHQPIEHRGAACRWNVAQVVAAGTAVYSMRP